jgi:hypothetical protein
MSAWKGPKQLIPMLVDRQQLAADPRNARAHDARSIKAIAESLDRFGQRKPIVVRRGVVIAGNGQLAAAEALGWDRIAVVDGSDLSDTDATAFGIADNRTAELSTWDTDILKELMADLPTDVSIALGFDGEELTALFAETPDGDEAPKATDGIDDTYTAKIASPVYEPRNECPPVADLVDRTKTVKLKAEIDAADLPADVAAFLHLAAERHAAFDFHRIADFYAHADAPTQRLMERSALVIIDFQQAIDQGYVRLSQVTGQLAEKEKPKAGDDDEV